jgi:peptidoglycan hydrolase CwlO-like protein
MSDERKTQEKPDKRSFEERVFARFDALDARMNSMDERWQSLEAKQHDTKPIWERALAEIAETQTEMREGFEKSRAESQSGFRKLERQLSALSVDVLEMRGTVSDLEAQVDKLDKSHV